MDPNLVIYQLFKSIMEMIVAPTIITNKSSSLKMGKRYFTIILLMARLSMRILQEPSFLGIKRKDTTQGLDSHEWILYEEAL